MTRRCRLNDRYNLDVDALHAKLQKMEDRDRYDMIYRVLSASLRSVKIFLVFSSKAASNVTGVASDGSLPVTCNGGVWVSKGVERGGDSHLDADWILCPD